jgi:hypothetical protein
MMMMLMQFILIFINVLSPCILKLKLATTGARTVADP